MTQKRIPRDPAPAKLIDEVATADITVRISDRELISRLRARAAESERSVEDEVRYMLQGVLDREAPSNLADLALELFGPSGGIELDRYLRQR